MENKKGRIIKALSGYYYVLLDHNIITCRARGNFRNSNVSPLVGDFATVRIENDSLGYVTEILERNNMLVRPKIANIDYNIIISSVKAPDFSSRLLDKMLVLNEYSNIKTIIVFTKLDKLNELELTKFSKIMNYYEKIGYIVFSNSNEDLDILKNKINNKFVSVSGQSGAGKSTFINKISNYTLNVETAKISKALGRGKHTTRHIEFHKIEDFYIADTPGFSSLDISFIEKENLKYLFREFEEYSCKFQTCNHIDEPICGVKNGIKEEYYKERYNNYKILFKEKEENKRRY